MENFEVKLKGCEVFLLKRELSCGLPAEHLLASSPASPIKHAEGNNPSPSASSAPPPGGGRLRYFINRYTTRRRLGLHSAITGAIESIFELCSVAHKMMEIK